MVKQHFVIWPNVKAPNLFQNLMQLRVGIHSGPIIVGVHYVGNRIPRLLKKKYADSRSRQNKSWMILKVAFA